MSQNTSPHIPIENRAEFFRSLFAEQKEKGLSLRQLSEAKEIPMTTLGYWLQKFRKQDGLVSKRSSKSKPDFVEIKPSTIPILGDALELEFPSGTKLRIPASYPTDTLVSLLRSLSC